MGSYEPSEFHSCQIPNCKNKLLTIHEYTERISNYPRTPFFGYFWDLLRGDIWVQALICPLLALGVPISAWLPRGVWKNYFQHQVSPLSLASTLTLYRIMVELERDPCSEQWDLLSLLRAKKRENWQPHGLLTPCAGLPVLPNTVLGHRKMSQWCFLTKPSWIFARGVVSRTPIGPLWVGSAGDLKGREGMRPDGEDTGTVELSDFWIYKSTFNF